MPHRTLPLCDHVEVACDGDLAELACHGGKLFDHVEKIVGGVDLGNGAGTLRHRKPRDDRLQCNPWFH